MFAGSGCGDETVSDGLYDGKEVRDGRCEHHEVDGHGADRAANAYLYWTRLVEAAMFVHVTDLLTSYPS